MKKLLLIVIVFFALVTFLGQTASDKCPDCNGTGKTNITCSFCNGRGAVVYNTAAGSMRVPCAYCKTTGKQICFSCNGTGKMSEYIRNSGPPVQNTPVPAQTHPANNTKLCTACGGSGLCSTCRGIYAPNCTYCNGVGKKTYGFGANATYETCAPCKGSGKNYCVNCYPSHPGKCSTCKGRKYI